MNKKIVTIVFSTAAILLFIGYFLYAIGLFSFFFYPNEEDVLRKLNQTISLQANSSNFKVVRLTTYEGKTRIVFESEGRRITVWTNVYNTFGTEKKGLAISSIDDSKINCWSTSSKSDKKELTVSDLSISDHNDVSGMELFVLEYNQIYTSLKKSLGDDSLNEVRTGLWCQVA